MLLNKLIINNIGVFLGRFEIDLKPKFNEGKNRPIILFGGMNGSGKTTIFEAIKLCLYGAESLRHKSDAKYKEYLREKINNSNGTFLKPYFSSIELEFDYSFHGEKNLYTVQRYWEKHGKGITETLLVKKDGKPIDKIGKEYWQEFIKELIPLGLSELFFFDAEKIQKIISDNDNFELKRSVISLLGLNLIERLQSDLKIYKRNLLKQNADPTLKYEIETLDKEINQKKIKIQEITYQIDSTLSSKIEDIKASINDLKVRIGAQGGEYLQKKQAILEDKIKAEKELEMIGEKIKELVAGLFPISLSKNLAIRLKKQLREEESIQLVKALSEVIGSKLEMFNEKKVAVQLFNGLEGVVISEKNKFLKSLIKNMKEVLIIKPEKPDISEVHSMSYKQVHIIFSAIDEALKEVPLKLTELTKLYEAKYREIQKIYEDIERIPTEDILKPLNDKLNLLHEELGKLLEEKKNLEDKKNILINEQTELLRKKTIIERKLYASEVNSKKIEVADKANKVLTKYYKELSKQKIGMLQKEFTNLFSNLHRKDDLISKIEIDTNTLDVFIYDKYGLRLNKNSLSSGELELYAIAMVWALAKISGRILPFAIDTPLARLDSQHRDHLIEKFFPHASHQILIFSTDTEVDEKYFKMLEPYISKTYKLEYIDSEHRSEIKEGYYWN